MNKEQFETLYTPLVRKLAAYAKEEQTRLKVSTKADESYVTNVDKELERIIREETVRHFPELNILGEEFLWRGDRC